MPPIPDRIVCGVETIEKKKHFSANPPISPTPKRIDITEIPVLQRKFPPWYDNPLLNRGADHSEDKTQNIGPQRMQFSVFAFLSTTVLLFSHQHSAPSPDTEEKSVGGRVYENSYCFIRLAGSSSSSSGRSQDPSVFV